MFNKVIVLFFIQKGKMNKSYRSLRIFSSNVKGPSIAFSFFMKKFIRVQRSLLLQNLLEVNMQASDKLSSSISLLKKINYKNFN